MRDFTHENSLHKQNARMKLWAEIRSSFSDRRCKLRLLTLPGFAGVRRADSLESQFRSYYRHGTLTGVEKVKRTYEQLLPYAQKQGMDLIRANVNDFFHDPTLRNRAFDVIFLDYCSGANERMLEGWEAMLREGWLAPGGIWAVTICHHGFACQKNEAWLGKGDPLVTLPNAMCRRMRNYRFRPGHTKASNYSCRDESSKALNMVLSIVFDLRKPRQRSTY